MANWSYYLGPWQWIVDDDMSYWSAPTGTAGLVDLRGLVDCGLAGSLGDAPYGFFAVDPAESLGLDYLSLGQGDCRELQPSQAIRESWQSLTGHLPVGNNLVDWLWSQMTNGSDPTAEGPTPPLMPTIGGNLDIHLGGHSLVKREAYRHGVHPHSAIVEDVLRRQFRNHFEAEDRGQKRQGQARRVLDFWLEKYKLDRTPQGQDWRRFVPSDLRRHVPGPLRHETTITDDFNRANSSTLGSSSEGWSWSTPSVGAFHVDTNQAEPQSGAASIYADSALSSDDHYCSADHTQFKLNSSSDQFNASGPTCRRNSAAETYYFIKRYTFSTFVNQVVLDKVVSGSVTSLGSYDVTGHDASHLKVEADGSAIKGYVDTVERISATDTSVTGNLYTGFRDTASVSSPAALARFDNFEAGDLSAGAATAALLLESGDTLLLESGDRLLLEGEGGAIAGAVSEIITFDDTLTNLLSALATVAESLQLADAPTGRTILRASTAESLTISEGAAAAIQASATIAEDVTLDDQPDVQTVAPVSAAEALQLSDTEAGTLAALASCAETLQVSDATAVSASLNTTLAESLATTDTASIDAAIEADVAEAVSLADAGTVTGTLTTAASESLALQAVADCRADLIAAASESVTITDTAAVIAIALADLSEAVALADSATTETAVQSEVAEQVDWADAPSEKATLTATALETVTLTVTADCLLTALAAVNEGLSVADLARYGAIVIVAGPFCAAASGVYIAGSHQSELYQAGSEQSQTSCH